MPNLSLRDLATVVDGNLSLGDLPPLDGDQQAVGPIHFDIKRLSSGSLYWDLSASLQTGFGRPELAFLRGAAGVIVEHQHNEPWAGRYTLRVHNCQLALKQLAYSLRQYGDQQTLVLCPSVTGPHWQSAMHALLDPFTILESAAQTGPFGTATSVAADGRLRILSLPHLHDPALHATLMISTPNLIILGHQDTAWLAKQPRPALHRILESLPPDGGLIYCDYAPHAPVVVPTSPGEPDWMKSFLAAGIRCLRIGQDAHADLRVDLATSSERRYRVTIGSQRLSLRARSLPQAMAEAAALATAILLGHDPTVVSRRFTLPPSDNRQPPRHAA